MKISVIIPSYNQAKYLECTILSCLGQALKPELIVMDGGSADGSVDIIKKYKHYLAYWQSKPDGGQSAAINAGMELATGDVLCWLNSDDYYLPGALDKVAGRLIAGNHQLLLGNCFHFTEGSAACSGSDLESCRHEHDLVINDYVVQPSAFWTRSLWNKVGPLRSDLIYTFDWDWFIRASRIADVITIPDYLSAYRFHATHKTGGGGLERKAEILSIYRAYMTDEQFHAVRDIDRFHDETRALEHNLKRLRLGRGRPALMRKIFPRIYSVFSLSEVARIRESLYS